MKLLDNINNNIICPILKIANKYKEKTHKPKMFSQNTFNLMEKRRKMKKPTTNREKIETAELNKLISKEQRKDNRKYREEMIKEIISQGKSFKIAKKKLNTGRLQFTGVREKDDSITKDRERIVARAREFYEELYSSDQMMPPNDQSTSEFHNLPDIEPWEVKLAVKQSKKGKAPGKDNLTIDLIEAAGDLVYGKIAFLFNQCLRQSKVPEDWNEAI